MERVPQSVAKRVVFRARLSSDHYSNATGKTIAITISKNGGAFGNPSAGATNATEIANGWYYVDLSTTDTNTLGPLIVRGTEGTIDDVGEAMEVANPNNAGFAGVPNAAAAASGGLPTSGTGANQISLSSGLVDLTQGAADKVFGASGATLPELAQAAPAATPTPRQALMLIYMALRNKLTTDATTKKIYNDAGTVICKQTLSDNGSTFTQDEFVSGP